MLLYAVCTAVPRDTYYDFADKVDIATATALDQTMPQWCCLRRCLL